MDQPAVRLAGRRSAMEAARTALSGLAEVLHEASGAELARLMSLVDEVGAQAGAARVAVTAEALARGEVAESGATAHTWVREHAPSLRQGGPGTSRRSPACSPRAALRGRTSAEPPTRRPQSGWWPPASSTAPSRPPSRRLPCASSSASTRI
ncbi:hypothetical protein H9L10_07445 [Phycicoccus endophyticus]|uniref:DUF222 domain-containing protein n=1 Tax=Phycicoccus endophyticus TaxID=1690220 RepID=A0A7G9R582_9MICO|nr:hypothetical protein [Phycicoccus endophyticus]QNN50757.1 hypothetical protein H9L10_07445 [Phycicoccus endophyticus]